MFDLYNKRKDEFDNYIINYFGDGKFEEVLNYSIESGKRIRPIILLEVYKMLGGKNQDLAYKYALALELVHNYSLIHDDLPEMDNDNYRRGRKTVHYKYGQDIAVLAGDSLLNYAYELIFEALLEDSSIENIKAGKVLGNYSGYEGMIKGQILDISNTVDSLEKVNEMYLNKTCRLFMAATKMAAYLSKSDDNVIEDMKSLGFYIGIAFQIQDDILDYEEDKNIDKTTYISFTGLEKGKKDMYYYTEKAIDVLNKYNENNFLIELINYLRNRKI